ncbi:MAG TPA: TrmJ/YjtD family RNA methyltransferase [Blastocatellia bacterium]|nr:TrmJ/YjtD family RNA methyltransferase [Blastocatellia bacterium]
MRTEDCRIILVRPRDPNNIGAAARAMKNFGLRDLVVVAPHPPVWEEVRSAVNATDVITSARVVPTIAEAVADCTLVVGTVDQTRLNSQQTFYTPAMLGREITASSERVALLFGSEKNGLTNSDLSFCHKAMSIPTRPDCPSMNLGQAVAICCYELARDEEALTSARSSQVQGAASAGEIEGLLEQAVTVLSAVGFLNPQNRQAKAEELRRSLLRLRLTRREVTLLRGALGQMEWRLRNSVGPCERSSN